MARAVRRPTDGPDIRDAHEPVGLRFPRLGIDAPIVRVGLLDDGSLDVPEDPKVLGWWADGAAPGAALGSVVLDGHIDSATLGVGVFAKLRVLEVGDRVELTAAGGHTTAYVVTGRREYPKQALPAEEVFSQTVGERLVLVTCGGRFDRKTRHYEDNIVVYAERA